MGSDRDLEAYTNHVRASAVALWAIAAELRMHAGDLVAEARARPARVRELYDSLADERVRRFGKDPDVARPPHWPERNGASRLVDEPVDS